MELFEFGYAAYVAFFAGAAVILVYAILLAAGASLAEWIVEHRPDQQRWTESRASAQRLGLRIKAICGKPADGPQHLYRPVLAREPANEPTLL